MSDEQRHRMAQPSLFEPARYSKDVATLVVGVRPRQWHHCTEARDDQRVLVVRAAGYPRTASGRLLLETRDFPLEAPQGDVSSGLILANQEAENAPELSAHERHSRSDSERSRLRGMLKDRLSVGASADLSHLRPCWLL